MTVIAKIQYKKALSSMPGTQRGVKCQINLEPRVPVT